MRINGVYFQESEASVMLKQIRDAIPKKERRQLMPLIEQAMNVSACKGLNGEGNCDAVCKSGIYHVKANVCCGGHAEVTIDRVAQVI